MKTQVLCAAAFLLLVGSPVYAQQFELQGAGTSESSAQQGRVILDSDANESASISSSESEEDTGIEHEDIGVAKTEPSLPDKDHKGEIDILSTSGQAPEPDDDESKGIEHEDIGAPAPRSESGEKGGTEDINIGVGELQEAVQHNETDLDLVRERASAISVSKVEVRGWDPKKKETILEIVKEHAEVHSGEDLKHFAQGALIEHPEIDLIETGTSSVSMRYHVPARLLGIFNTSLEQEATITFGDGKHGRVKVKFPWLRFFYRVDERFHVGSVEEALMPEVDDEVLIGFEHGGLSPSKHAGIIQSVIDAITG